jgi:hypothetical protein
MSPGPKGAEYILEDFMFRNHILRFACVVGAMWLLISSALGDSLQLRNGSLIKGTFLGGTGEEISFQVGTRVQRYALADVVSVDFDDASRAYPTAESQLPPGPPQPESDPTLTTSRSRDTVTLPSSTRIMIRTIDAIDSDRNQVGDMFQASLERPLVVDDLIVVPKGTEVYGRLTQATEAGRMQGRSQLKLELTGIVVNGETIPLVTGEYSVSGSSRGANTAMRVGTGAAVGAVIGAMSGRCRGAAIGAGVGAGAGTAVQVMTKGEQVHVPNETLLEFVLQQEVRMPVADFSSQAAK